MPNPRDAMIAHETLRASLTRPTYAEYLQEWSEDVYRKKSGPLIVGPDKKPNGRAMAEDQVRLLARAETYYVSADMGEVAVMASLGLDQLDQFSHDLWPTDDGFLLFQRALVHKDVWGKSVTTKAVTWERKSAQNHAGTLFTTYADMDDPRDDFGNHMDRPARDHIASLMGRLQTSEVRWYADGERVGPAMVKPRADYEKFADPELGYTLVQECANEGRTFLALLMLLNQTVVVKTKHDLRPASPKRARKMRIPGQVTVITLRHAAAQKQEGETHVEWQYRWLVRGHWRSQAVGPDYPFAQEVEPGRWRARIYIAPFIKGPEDKPLVITKKIYSLTR